MHDKMAKEEMDTSNFRIVQNSSNYFVSISSCDILIKIVRFTGI